MHPQAAEKIAHVVVEQYRRCQPGHATTFHMMFGLIAALTNLPWEDALRLTAGIFKKEFAAFEAKMFPAPIHKPHAGRFEIDFRPDLN
jgi:hypothetical protein